MNPAPRTCPPQPLIVSLNRLSRSKRQRGGINYYSTTHRQAQQAGPHTHRAHNTSRHNLNHITLSYSNDSHLPHTTPLPSYPSSRVWDMNLGSRPGAPSPRPAPKKCPANAATPRLASRRSPGLLCRGLTGRAACVPVLRQPIPAAPPPPPCLLITTQLFSLQ